MAKDQAAQRAKQEADANQANVLEQTLVGAGLDLVAFGVEVNGFDLGSCPLSSSIFKKTVLFRYSSVG